MTEYQLWFAIEFIIFALIFIPTIVAFFTGAPWIPTPMPRAKRMLELADLKPGERVYDLGCGDGRLVHLAAKHYEADAVGLELSPLVYAWAKVRNFFLRSSSKILMRDFRKIDYRNAKALVFYLLPDILKVMRPKFEMELRPGARIVSYAFEIDGWTPVYTEPRDPKRHYGRIFVYEVPKSIKANGNEAKK
ncbi:class I SAM-dependent methyltransferase [Candidatus Peregrinibacteria bacterium]|nr:class I SAM-dependent methyltransferase [Candidatus Peregrinibacteria bacterium]